MSRAQIILVSSCRTRWSCACLNAGLSHFHPGLRRQSDRRSFPRTGRSSSILPPWQMEPGKPTTDDFSTLPLPKIAHRRDFQEPDRNPHNLRLLLHLIFRPRLLLRNSTSPTMAGSVSSAQEPSRNASNDAERARAGGIRSRGGQYFVSSHPGATGPKARSRIPETCRRLAHEITVADSKSADATLDDLLAGASSSRAVAMFAALMTSQESHREQMNEIRA